MSWSSSLDVSNFCIPNAMFSEHIETVKEGGRRGFLVYLGVYSLCIH